MQKTITDHIRLIMKRSEELEKKTIDSQINWRSTIAISKAMKISRECALLFAYDYFITLSKKSFGAQDIREKVSTDPFDLPRIFSILNELYKMKLLAKSDNVFDEEYQVSKKIFWVTKIERKLN